MPTRLRSSQGSGQFCIMAFCICHLPLLAWSLPFFEMKLPLLAQRLPFGERSFRFFIMASFRTFRIAFHTFRTSQDILTSLNFCMGHCKEKIFAHDIECMTISRIRSIESRYFWGTQYIESDTFFVNVDTFYKSIASFRPPQDMSPRQTFSEIATFLGYGC